ncbi:MAG: sensor domain-containing diguanylate cyclase [Tissierellia bacterium]|nr:sensor domain-containing diguanylate cyclase [Tissierellia bacterium]
MDNILYNILNEVDAGIVITNVKLEITFWNSYMEHLTNITRDEALDNNIYNILPNLRRNYFKEAVDCVIKNSQKKFFSSALHKGLVSIRNEINLKISKFAEEGEEFLLFEFIDVTSQVERINQLKNYVNKLSLLNQDLQKKEKIIKKLAYYDQLTGLANRTLFYKLANKFLYNAKRNNHLLGLMFLDVNKFKCINDTYGHEAGDKVLVKVAKMLLKTTRKGDVVTRFGGDEFLILLPYIKSIDDYKVIVSRINNFKNSTITYEEKKIDISLSIGVSFFPRDGDSIDELIVKADKAMYIAKNINTKHVCSL